MPVMVRSFHTARLILPFAPVAQRIAAPRYERGGCRFDSCLGCARATSSVVEQLRHREKVGGSIPSSPTEGEAEGSKRVVVSHVQVGFKSHHPPRRFGRADDCAWL